MVRILLEHGLHATMQNKNELTSLHAASMGGHVDVACLLLEHGADATAQEKDGGLHYILHRLKDMWKLRASFSSVVRMLQPETAKEGLLCIVRRGWDRPASRTSFLSAAQRQRHRTIMGRHRWIWHQKRNSWKSPAFFASMVHVRRLRTTNDDTIPENSEVTGVWVLFPSSLGMVLVESKAEVLTPSQDGHRLYIYHIKSSSRGSPCRPVQHWQIICVGAAVNLQHDELSPFSFLITTTFKPHRCCLSNHTMQYNAQ